MAASPVSPEHQGFTPRQIRRASNVVTGLIYKGMNDFCGRDMKIYSDCMAHFTALHDADEPPPEYRQWPFPGYCAKEKEHLGTCRLVVADSILTHCHAQLNDLTAAIAQGGSGDSVQRLTDSLYKCGMRPVPGLYDGKPRRLPGRLEQGVVDVVQERRDKEEFVRVVTKQARDEYAQRRGQKKQWKPEGDGDKE